MELLAWSKGLGTCFVSFHEQKDNDRAKAMLERVGLAHRMNHLANEMSGGEQQRVAIARAMVNEPSFLLADEPTGNVDSQNSSSLMDLFLQLNVEGTTIILITHDMGIASLASRQIVLKDGFVESDSSQNRKSRTFS